MPLGCAHPLQVIHVPAFPVTEQKLPPLVPHIGSLATHPPVEFTAHPVQVTPLPLEEEELPPEEEPLLEDEPLEEEEPLLEDEPLEEEEEPLLGAGIHKPEKNPGEVWVTTQYGALPPV